MGNGVGKAFDVRVVAATPDGAGVLSEVVEFPSRPTLPQLRREVERRLAARGGAGWPFAVAKVKVIDDHGEWAELTDMERVRHGDTVRVLQPGETDHLMDVPFRAKTRLVFRYLDTAEKGYVDIADVKTALNRGPLRPGYSLLHEWFKEADAAGTGRVTWRLMGQFARHHPAVVDTLFNQIKRRDVGRHHVVKEERLPRFMVSTEAQRYQCGQDVVDRGVERTAWLDRRPKHRCTTADVFPHELRNPGSPPPPQRASLRREEQREALRVADEGLRHDEYFRARDAARHHDTDDLFELSPDASRHAPTPAPGGLQGACSPYSPYHYYRDLQEAGSSAFADSAPEDPDPPYPPAAAAAAAHGAHEVHYHQHYHGGAAPPTTTPRTGYRARAAAAPPPLQGGGGRSSADGDEALLAAQPEGALGYVPATYPLRPAVAAAAGDARAPEGSGESLRQWVRRMAAGAGARREGADPYAGWVPRHGATAAVPHAPPPQPRTEGGRSDSDPLRYVEGETLQEHLKRVNAGKEAASGDVYAVYRQRPGSAGGPPPPPPPPPPTGNSRLAWFAGEGSVDADADPMLAVDRLSERLGSLKQRSDAHAALSPARPQHPPSSLAGLGTVAAPDVTQARELRARAESVTDGFRHHWQGAGRLGSGAWPPGRV